MAPSSSTPALPSARSKPISTAKLEIFLSAADFPNPDGLLRHGQTGNVLDPPDGEKSPRHSATSDLRRFSTSGCCLRDSDKDDMVRQREIEIQQTNWMHIYVIKEGTGRERQDRARGRSRQVRDGQKVECEFREPKEVMGNQKNKGWNCLYVFLLARRASKRTRLCPVLVLYTAPRRDDPLACAVGLTQCRRASSPAQGVGNRVIAVHSFLMPQAS